MYVCIYTRKAFSSYVITMARHLIDAIKRGDVEQAKYILLIEKYGCLDCQTGRRDGTALFWACAKGFMELVQLLLKKGANVNGRNSYNATPILAAADRNRYHIIRLLIQNGADVNAQTTSGDTACHLAAYRGHREAVKILVEAGADLELTNAKFRTPFDDAERQGHFDLLPLLDAANQNCKAKSSKSHREPSGPSLLSPGLQRRSSSGDLAPYDSLSRESSYEECTADTPAYSHDALCSSDFCADRPTRSLPSSPSWRRTGTQVPYSTPAVTLGPDDVSLVVSNDLSFVSDSSTALKRSVSSLNIPV